MNPGSPRASLQKQLNSGATSLVLLALLQRAGRAMYGYEIAKALEGHSQCELPMKQGALYPALRSLEKQGLLSSFTKQSDLGPKRKYYQVTPAGAAALEQWKTAWNHTKQFVDSILECEHDPQNQRGDSTLPQQAEAAAR